MADTDLQQFVINIGTQAQIEAGISGGTITSDMLSIATDASEYVDTSTNQTVGGVKTLTDDLVRQSSDISDNAGGYIINNTELDTTTTPTSATYHYLRCRDKNDNLLGDIRFVRGTDGSQLTQIVARTGISGSEISAYFGVVSGVDGTGSVNGSRTVLRSIGNLGRPSSTDYSAVTVKSSGSSYTAPNTGYIYVSLSRSAASWALTLQANNITTKGTTNTNNNTNNVAAWLPVKKGDSYTVSYSGQDSISIRFVSAVLEE